MPRKTYVVCTKCKRVLSRRELIFRDNRNICPFCGNDKFTTSFSNIILIIDPKESNIAKSIKKNKRGLFALTVEA